MFQSAKPRDYWSDYKSGCVGPRENIKTKGSKERQTQVLID